MLRIHPTPQNLGIPVTTRGVRDASDRGTGACSLAQQDVYGHFTNNDLSIRTNQKEFQGAIYALRSHMMRNTTVHFWTDSTTLYHNIR